MTLLAPMADALLEASVIGSFTRTGLTVRSRLLPEFTAWAPARLDGQNAVITGATSGIGHAAATELARLGAAVHFLARDRARAASAAQQISEASGSTSVSYAIADMEDLDSVRSFAAQYLRTHGTLDVLVHNAGAIHSSYQTSKDGTELTVAGQVAAPFLLTSLLLPALQAAGRSKVITVSSAGIYTQRFDPATLQMPASGYRGVTAYAKAKRAQVALSRDWARRLAGTGVAFHAMHPGWVNTPGIAAALPRFYQVMRPLLRTPEQGADTIIWLATSDPAPLRSGRFWHDRRMRSEYRLPWTRDARPASAPGPRSAIEAAGRLSSS
jgi:NAD(P)-dependent dehydrogenase (short-subunit alcohol dehydrogenase family)